MYIAYIGWKSLNQSFPLPPLSALINPHKSVPLPMHCLPHSTPLRLPLTYSYFLNSPPLHFLFSFHSPSLSSFPSIPVPILYPPLRISLLRHSDFIGPLPHSSPLFLPISFKLPLLAPSMRFQYISQ